MERPQSPRLESRRGAAGAGRKEIQRPEACRVRLGRRGGGGLSLRLGWNHAAPEKHGLWM